MIEPGVVLVTLCLYMGLLFAIALRVERRTAKGKSPANNPYVYSLSLAVYCTAWTYYGSVGKAATSGVLFLPIYLGPTLCILLWWIVLRKMTRIKTDHRITSIADFISARYNKSQPLAALATSVSVLGILPYVSLQIKAIVSSFLIITTPSSGGLAGAAPAGHSGIAGYVGPGVVVLMIIFTIMLGARRLEPTERHEGMVMALAVQGVVKLAAFLAVGFFVTHALFGGFGEVFERTNEILHTRLLEFPEMGHPPYIAWTSYMVLSMSSILFLPRQFHVAVIENSDENHILTAMWFFPLYMLLINLFVLPVAMGGLLKGYPISAADSFVLMLPLDNDMTWLSLLVFIGGVSAAAGMITVSSVTVATMVTNHHLLPIIEMTPRLSFLKRHLLGCRWWVVAAFIFTGYLFEEFLMKPYMLVNMGLISFTAALQFAPPILGGIFWRKGNAAGALLGLGAGFAIWCYTQLIPSFVKNGWLSTDLLDRGPFGIAFLKPEQLLGLAVLDPISHTVIWSMIFNCGLYVIGSLYFEQTAQEQSIAEQFVGALDAGHHPLHAHHGEAYINLHEKTLELEHLLCQYFSDLKASEAVDRAVQEMGIKDQPRISIVQLIELHNRVEKSLAGAIGAPAAFKALHHGTVLTARESRELSDAYADILAGLKVSPSELKARIDYYQERETLLMQHAQELEEKIGQLQKEIAERMRVQQALLESEEKFRGLVETMNEGLKIEDENGRITYVNDRLCKLWCCGRDEIVGHSSAEFMPEVSPLESSAADERLEGSHVMEAVSYEVTWTTKDGRKISTIVSSVPFLDSNGMYKGCFSVITDISCMKALQREKANLISMFAHDMRSSLTGIHGLGLRLMTKSAVLDEEKKEEYLRIINKEAAKLESLVDDFLEFSRLETGRLKLNFRAVSLDRELLEIFEFYQPRAAQRGIKLELHLEDALPIIEADVNRLRRVFTNLLDNALKFSGESGTVSIIAEDDEHSLVVKIADQGIGIDPEELPFIFDLFHRARGGEKREGYGIGLATVKAIVEGHGGKVKVESEPNEGSVFTVVLPKAAKSRQ